MESNVFSRTETPEGSLIISDRVYNLIIGLALCWGFGVNLLIVKYIDVELLMSINILYFIIGYFASCFLGVYLFNKSDNPAISFLGYNFIVVPFGLVLNIIISAYDPVLVFSAIKVTAIVTAIMMLAGSLWPAFFRKIIGALTIALFAVIIVQFFEIFVLKEQHGIIDWIVVIIFCGYIGYDWGRANAIPKTVDNAIDSAAALYMDIINLFVRILRIMGRRR